MFNLLKRKYHNLISDQKFSEILIGSTWALGAMVTATLASMTTSIIIARIYGVEIIGIVAMLNSFFMLSTIFTVLGTNTSILRLIPEHLTKYSPTSAFNIYRKIQYFVAGVSMITGSILFLSSGFIAETIFSKPNLRFYFALGAAFIIFKSLMILNTQAVRGIRLIRLYAFMQTLPSLSKLIIIVTITIFFFHKDNPIYAMFGSITFTALAGVWIMERAFKKIAKPSDTLHSIPMKEIMATSLPMLMTATMAIVTGQTGVIMLGIFRSEAEVGYYSVAVKLAFLTAFILKAVITVAAPKFSNLFYSNKIDELFYVAKKSAKLIFWTTVPILLSLIVLGKSIITLLYGSNFIVAYWAMIILIMGNFLTSISGATAMFMNMTGNHKIFRNIIFISVLTNVGLSVLLIPDFGIYGAAVSSMASLVLWSIITLFYIKMKYGKTTGYFPFLA